MTRSTSLLVALIFSAAVLIVPMVISPFTLTLMNYVGIYTLVALGLVLLTGSGGLTSFGQAAFVGIGAYTTAYLSVVVGWSPWIGLLAALGIVFVTAIIIGYCTLHLGGHYLPITTIAWGVAIYLLFGNFESLGRYGGMTHIPAIEVFGISLEQMDRMFYLIWLLVGLSLLSAVNLIHSRQGRAMRALRGGTHLVESLGIDSFRIKLALFVISALLAAVAGWLYAHMLRFISPAIFDLRAGIEFLLMAVLGGSGFVGGALIGATTVTIVKNWLQDLLPMLTSNSGNLEVIVFGSLFILLLQYSPKGIAPVLFGFAQRFPFLRRFMTSTLGAETGNAIKLPVREMPAKGSLLLKVQGLTRKFGGLTAVNNVEFEILAGTIVSLIGPNGAGKSTTFNLISGMLAPTEGHVTFASRDVTGEKPRAIAAEGIARTFQHVKLRPDMSLLENVMLGAYTRTKSGYLAGIFRLDLKDEAGVRELALQQLREVGLGERPLEKAGNLPLGQQRLLEIARALAADPVLLMLDEPAAGLRGPEKRELSLSLKKLRAKGMTILLVEHDMEFLMGLADNIVVLNFGCKLAEGPPAAIRANKQVQEAYLGSVA